MVNIVLELALVDDVVDFFADTLDATIRSQLANNELVVLRLAELQRLIDLLRRVGNDLFQLERAELAPLLLDSARRCSRLLLILLIVVVASR